MASLVVLLVVTSSGGVCEVGMCGCAEGAGATTCKPLGECEEYRLHTDAASTPAVWHARCRCFTGFAGARCDACDIGHARWPHCYGAPASMTSAAAETVAHGAAAAPSFTVKNRAALFSLSQFEASYAALLVCLCFCGCCAAAVRWRLGCCGRCLSDVMTYSMWFFEGPDSETEALLADPGCDQDGCVTRAPHYHRRNGTIVLRRQKQRASRDGGGGGGHGSGLWGMGAGAEWDGSSGGGGRRSMSGGSGGSSDGAQYCGEFARV